MSEGNRSWARARGSRGVRLAVALLAAACVSGMCVASASAREVVYNNQNAVPKVGAKTEDTWSQSYAGYDYTSVGGMVEFGGTARTLKTISVEVDNFVCGFGEYEFENCRSKENKKFKFEMTVKVYEVKGTEERGAKLAEATATAKLPYRPTTNVGCPDVEGEGKGFGANCQVGGILGSVEFRGFSGVTLRAKAIIELVPSSTSVPVNIGVEAAESGESGNWQALPGSGAPEVGKQPLANEIFANGLATPAVEAVGWQPVFVVEAAKH